MSSSESFRVMEAFIDPINDKELALRLIQALEGRKSFANFKLQIDNSGEYREVWFAFKSETMLEYVKGRLDMDSI